MDTAGASRKLTRVTLHYIPVLTRQNPEGAVARRLGKSQASCERTLHFSDLTLPCAPAVFKLFPRTLPHWPPGLRVKGIVGAGWDK